jgi:hypothetical protein
MGPLLGEQREAPQDDGGQRRRDVGQHGIGRDECCSGSAVERRRRCSADEQIVKYRRHCVHIGPRTDVARAVLLERREARRQLHPLHRDVSPCGEPHEQRPSIAEHPDCLRRDLAVHDALAVQRLER